METQMIKKLNQLTKIGILFFGISLSFTSCEKDETFVFENKEHIGKNPNEVSLKKFTQTTQIENIDSFVKKQKEKNNEIFARENIEFTFDDFIIDTDLIYQCTLNNGNISFSFHIDFIGECLPTEEFNLVIQQDEQGEWLSKIYQLNANTDGAVQNRFSSIEEIYSSNGLPDGVSARWVWVYGETTTYHCTNTGSCASGICDNCGLCVTTTITYQQVYISDNEPDPNPLDPNFNYNGGGGGGSTGMPNMIERNQLISLLELQPSSQQHMWVSGSATLEQMDVLLDYLSDNMVYQNVTSGAKNFANEIIMLLRWNGSGNSETDLNALNFIVEAKKQDKIYNNFDHAFLSSVNQFMLLDSSNQSMTDPIYLHFVMKCIALRAAHPDWSDLKIYWEASKDIVHITLDVFGLVPVVGEAADLINGVLYTIEGDGVNATLSYASSVPVAGWAAFGTKYAIKIVDASQTASTIVNKVQLTWKVLADGTIYFGANSTCRAQLRKVLGLAVGNLNKAHHIIPLNLQTNPIVQKAAKSGSAFHMNEALNGIPLSNAVHNGSHFNYDGKIFDKLEDFRINNPNATPDQCYNEVIDIINDIRAAIANNPTTPINQLDF